ncbi:MAG TPA: zinc-dependent alcohol dehydrogenase family protein [Stellaceae bacterium]|jgi:trans-2-enoyl-CoA reductase|nr:zinc-dependent alcohol dehydrogenase family protein [Stellaceae bacterium]
MKKVEITDYGTPENVARCVEAPDVGAPGPGEIVFDVLAFPINPADISFCRGNYRLHPPLPATPGAECVGRVAAVGAGVGDIRPGDLVVNMQRENWVQRRRVRADDAIPLPSGLDLAQAAMLRINPATALLLLDDHVALKPGDWVIQDVANSAVGRHLIVLAKAKGVRTLNVVRRDDVSDELKALGADVVLTDGPDLAQRAQQATGGAPIRLGIDAVSGEACKRIADSVADGGVVVSYGSMSGADLVISRAALGRGITLKAFMLGDGLAKRPREQVRAIYAELAAKLRDGVLKAPVDATYPIDDIKAALAHAQRGHRNGKVLVLPNGPL